MAIRKIEFVEESVKVGTAVYYAGDVKSFPKEEADEYIRVGWAKDPETGEQGDRKPGSQVINVQNAAQQIV